MNYLYSIVGTGDPSCASKQGRASTCSRALAYVLTGVMSCGGSAFAATCSMSVQGVAFGSYDVLSSVSNTSNGLVTVTCDAVAPYTIALSAGSGTYSNRFMRSGAHQLNYNLYVDPLRAVVWGDGTQGTSAVSGAGGVVPSQHPVYGVIEARQNVRVGTYSDMLVVTLTY